MRNLSLTILFLFSVSLLGCQKSNEEKAKEAIRTYLNENLDDMSTYESVKFGSLDTVYMVDYSGTSDASANVKYKLVYQMFHSYRLKDANGIKYLTKNYFELDNNFEVFNKGDISFKNFGVKGVPILQIPTDKEVEAYLRKQTFDTDAADTAAADTAAAR